MDLRVRDVLDCFAIRAPTLALHQRNTELLREGLLAMAVSDAIQSQETKDSSMWLALYYVSSQRLGASPSVLFGEVADRVASTPFSNLIRNFGNRPSVTLSEFGWIELEGSSGPDFAIERRKRK
jgi:hypothetical protein